MANWSPIVVESFIHWRTNLWRVRCEECRWKTGYRRGMIPLAVSDAHLRDAGHPERMWRPRA